MNRVLKVVKNPFVLAFFFGIACLHWVNEYSKLRLSAPPPLVQVGDWTLTNQYNQSFGSEDLRGKVVIASFFFTRCPTICPALMNSMKEVQKRFTGQNDQVAFVSITTDPAFDTPSVLASYAQQHNLNWHFLTGSNQEITQVVENQMKFAIGAGHHLAELVLFDQNGNLRGKFSTDSIGLASLTSAAKFLLDKQNK